MEDRRNRILNHKLYKECYFKIAEAESGRRYCGHNMEHFLAVARIAMILNLKEKTGVTEELIYAAALLHDIGRHIQYENGAPHELAGAKIAPAILADCGFTQKETDAVIDAILRHRDRKAADAPGLPGLLYRADKMSRPCFACPAETTCNWKQERKNLTLRL